MSGVKAVNPGINISDLTIDQLKDLQIEDKSAGRGFGRRICVKTETTDLATHAITTLRSKDVTFKALFNKAQELSANANTVEDIEQIKAFLGRFKEAESGAASGYKDLPDYSLYKFRTWFHRIFDFTSHETKIDNLQAKLDKKFAKMDITELRKMEPDLIVARLGAKSDEYLAKVIKHKIDANHDSLDNFDPLGAVVYLEKITDADTTIKSSLGIKVAHAVYHLTPPANPLGGKDYKRRMLAIDIVERYAKNDIEKENVLFRFGVDTIGNDPSEVDWVRNVIAPKITNDELNKLLI